MSLAQLFYAKSFAKQFHKAQGPRSRLHKASSRRRPLFFETLEPRLLLSAAPYLVQAGVALTATLENPRAPALTAPPLADQAPAATPAAAPGALVPKLSALTLVDPNPANLAGQVFYLDHDGASAVTYNGPLRVDGIDVPKFQAPAPLTGQEPSILGSVLTELNQESANLGVTFTDVRPAAGTDYSTIFLGGNDSAFSQYGSFYGLAEKVDIGNQDHNDDAFVFSDKLYTAGMTAGDYESALTAVIDHEAKHLLGYEHTDEDTAGLNGVAAGAPSLPNGLTITVDSKADENIRNNELTLREAILIADGTLDPSSLTPSEQAQVVGTPTLLGTDTIDFNIPGGGIQSINVGAGGLPFITSPVIIDGTTQPGFDSTPIVDIYASGAGVNQNGEKAAGLEITAGNSVVKGLNITGSPSDGIRLWNGGGNTIIGNFIGTDPTGTETGVVFRNGENGILIEDSANNQIGGAGAGEGNVISGNRGQGIEISDGGSTGNQVQGNLIGTDITGTVGLGNASHGVLLTASVGRTDYPSNNLIGGLGAHQGNAISANGIDGVDVVRGAGNSIQGNFIGTTLDGTKGLGNSVDGVFIIDAPDTRIGGVETFAPNVISANRKDGIEIVGSGAKGTVIQQNDIGTDLAEQQDLGNGEDGIFIHGQFMEDPRLFPISPPVSGAPSDTANPSAILTTIGGDTAIAGNFISGNDRDGVRIADGTTGTLVEANYIGVNGSGNNRLANTEYGVAIIDSPHNTISGATAVNGVVVPYQQVISGNHYGVYITGSGANFNQVVGNLIGLDETGTVKIANGAGVFIDSLADNNTIGGTTTLERNIISGNALGVAIFSDHNLVQGNFIGTDVSGSQALGNVLGGIDVAGNNNTIGGVTTGTGNVISGNLAYGVHIAAAKTGNQIQGNNIGTDMTAMLRLANSGDGVFVEDAPGNTIGGPAFPVGFAPGNVISGNIGSGVNIVGPDAAKNQVLGNIIGLNAAGVFLGNGGNGVRIEDGHDNTIGGTADGARNVISGNSQNGVEILRATKNQVLGNFIGTDIVGTSGRGNLASGVLIQESSENVIGGATAGARNIISGNDFVGVDILDPGSYRNQVQGNYIGTDATGLLPLANTNDGVLLALGASSNTIGGSNIGERNVISGNFKSGVRIADPGTTDNLVQDNFIGVGKDGITSVGNDEHGVFIDNASNNVIGGLTPVSGNVIAFNGSSLKQKGHGVVVASGTGNRITNNSIYENAGRGIDLGNDSFTLNDPGDADIGANNLQNYPVVVFVTFSGATKTTTWDLNSTPNSTFTIEFFSNAAPDPSGFGEGKEFLNSMTVTTDAQGFAEFTATFQASDKFISTTATDSHNNTSEFSMVDTDGDGLADAWEGPKNADGTDAWQVSPNENNSILGSIDINEDGIPDLTVAGAVNSKGFAVSPNRKDLFVEVDAMAGFAPDPTTLPRVEAAFAAAPADLVNNPDGSTGIALHAILDEADLPDIPFRLTSGNAWPTEFDYLKSLFFGSPVDEVSPNWVPNGRAAKELVYRYAIFGDHFVNDTGISSLSGLSENFRTSTGLGLGGNDLMVALGTWVRDPGPDNKPGGGDDTFGGTNDDQAGTFMHELGHTLGLFHGGNQIGPGADGIFGTSDDTDVNNKPNYHSIMNYIWQTPDTWMTDLPGTDSNQSGIIGDALWNLDYSRSNFGVLNESQLLETAGIGGNDLQAVEIFTNGKATVVPESGPVDFNQNGTIDTAPVSANINGGPAGQLLTGYEDWSHLRFDFRELPTFGASAHGKEADADELTLDLKEQLDAGGKGPGIFQFSLTNTYAVDEASGLATITVVRAGGTDGTVSVDYATSDGTALAGADYTTAAGTLVFADGEYKKSFTIPILNDLIPETTETLGLTLSNPTGGATLGQRNAAVMSILDDDSAGTLQLSSPSYTAKETDKTATITVTRTGGTVGSVSVNYATEDASATAGNDYAATSGTLTFANGESSKTFTVPILDDAIVEGIESLRIKLSNPTGGASLGKTSEAPLIIQDVEPGTLQLSDAQYQIGESGGAATITVTRTNGADGVVSVDFATSDGTATGLKDYTPVSGTLTFADGETAKSFTIPILDDTIAEPTETVHVTLSNPTDGAALGTPNSADLAILDDEPPTLQFNAPSLSVNEAAGTATVQVVRTGSIDETVSVDVATADGTARAGNDYVASTGTLRFLAGDTSETFTVPILDNKVADGDRTLQLVLSNPSADAQVGASGTATLNIVDDESASAATFVVTNTNDSGPGSLRQAMLDANARPGTDLIHFNIPGAGVHTIRPLSPLPTITSPVTIDGYTQPGASPNTLAVGDNAVLEVELDGSGVPSFFSASGLHIAAGNSIVRGLVINRSGGAAGILIDTQGGSLIEGNYIGTDPTGTIGFSNVSGGLEIQGSSDNLVGGTGPASRNVISGNGDGILIESDLQPGTPNATGNLILGNYIGVAADGASPLGNYIGIDIGTSDALGASKEPPGNTVGGIEPGAGNIIAFNAFEGVSIVSGSGDAVRGNSIFSNDPTGHTANFLGGLGIDLVSYGDLNLASAPITVNDPGDFDTGVVNSGPNTFIDIPGPNLLQNFPVLSSAINANGILTIKGRLDSAPKTTFQIDLYANEQIDPSGYGEGQTYIGTTSTTTDPTGHAEFTVTLPVAAPNGRFITATATDPGNNTSEFSARITVGDVLGSVFVVNTTDDHDDGVANAQDTTLREAILAADNHPGPDTILFNIPGTGVQTIRPQVNLPPVTDPVTIDGYSQPGARPNTQAVGFDGILLIEIKGGGSTSEGIRTGLIIAGGNSTVRGLVINSMPNALYVQGAGNNTIEGNIIGIDPTGNINPFSDSSSLTSSLTVAQSGNNMIGGGTPQARNLLVGLLLKLGANDNRVQGNYIGTRADGLGSLAGFGGEGVAIETSSRNLIGGAGPGERNVISGGGGVSISGTFEVKAFGAGVITITHSATSNRVLGNFLGVAADGVLPLGNSGVQLSGSANDNSIGGIQPGEGNIIAWNGFDGVYLTRTESSTGTVAFPVGNAIRGNSILSNGLTLSLQDVGLSGLGIDLDGETYTPATAVTLNDNGDVDGGPNNLQNFPVLSSAMSANGAITIQGRLDSTPRTTYQIDLYANEQMDPTGYGEGQTYLGTISTTTDFAGHADFSAMLPVAVPNGRFITATATDPGNNTSEFSARITVGDALGSVFVVNTTDDHDDGVANAQDTTLREAILAANNHPGPDTILFNIPGTGVQTITPLSNLPSITDPVTIDGYTQPGARANSLAEDDDAVLLIQISDGNANRFGDQIGLNIRAGDTTVRGLVLNGFLGPGINIEENGGDTIEGNFLGTDPSGTVALGGGGVNVFASSDNLIGGTTPAARNVISGFGTGVQISGGSGPAIIPDPATFYVASDNLVEGNYIGTDRTGTIALGAQGVVIGGSSNNIIGGTTSGARNVIASVVSLGGAAVQGTPANNILQGNYIGTDVSGEVALGGGGVQVSGAGNIVGGTLPGAGNVISGNSGGVSISGGSNVVQGNRIGTDKDGILALGNKGDGIGISGSGNLIGGLEPGAGNVISGNGGNGISLAGFSLGLPTPTGNLIQGNFIGTQADGVSPLPNLGDGVVVTPTGEQINGADIFGLGAVNDTIGGIESGAGNVIAFNGGNGVDLAGGSATAGSRIAILGNSIYSNGKLGIDLKGNGPTPNDTGDGDAGDNGLQNFPVLTSITNTGSSMTVQGTLNSRPSSTYRLEFFDNVAFDSSNFGEGGRFIGTTDVTTDSTGNAGFTVAFQVAVPLTHVITSTATDAQGNTSEFSGRQPDQSPGATANLAVTKSDAPDPVLAGQLLTYTIAVTNNGPDDATNVILLDTLPAGVTFQSGTQDIFGLVGTSVFGSLGTIASGSTATVQITVLPTTPGVVTNVVKVASDQYEPDTTNNTASANTTINPDADLSVTESAGAVGPVGVGREVPFKITVTNGGPSLAAAVRLTDTLPKAMTFASFLGSIAGTQSGGVITWDLGDLAAGASEIVFFSATMNEAGVSTNTVQIASTTADPNPANNTATLDITALSSADLALVKTAVPTPAAVGGMLTYTLTVSNSGPSDAGGVILTDTLPTNVTFDSASASQGSFALANGVVTFDLGLLANGSQATAEIAVTPTVEGSVLTNSAQVTETGTFDPNSFNNHATLETIVGAPYLAGLYGAAQIGGGPSTLYGIDPDTGTATFIGPIGFDRISGMDFDPQTDVLYATGNRRGSSTSVLLTIDPRTGVGTEVGRTNIGSINGNNSVTDISFRNSDDMLFAYLGQGDLATIDITTGRATFVGTTFAAGGLGNALAFSQADTLYHGDNIDLDTLDTGTGLATLLVPLSFSAPASDVARLNAMDFDPKTGILFASLNNGFGGANENYLATADITTGAVTIIGPTVAGLDAIAFIGPPEQEVNHPPVAAPIGDHTVDEGELFSQAGSFTDPDASDSWTATVDYGDGSGPQALALSGSTFQLSHVFVEEGTYPVMVKVMDNKGGVGSDTGNVTVADAALTASGVAVSGIERTSTGSLTVATFTDANPNGTASEFTATIDWGDSSPVAAGIITFDATTQLFTVQGQHSYLDEGKYTISVVIVDVGGSTTSTTGTATVVDAPLTAAGVNVTGTEGASTGPVPVATFTDANPTAAASDFTATITWGDGQQGPGVLTANKSGGFDVVGTNLYAEEGTYTVGVLIQDAGGSTATATSTASITDASLSATGVNLTGGEGTSTGPVAVATFTDADPNRAASDFTATITWGDEQNGTGVITANTSGGFTVTGTHTYGEEGGYAIGVAITDLGGSTTSVTSTATVSDPAVVATGVAVTATEGHASGPVPVATFTDPGGPDVVSDYSASIQWGDGSAATPGIISFDGISQIFTVSGDHTYTEEGTDPILVTLQHDTAPNVTATSTATVSDPAVLVTGGFQVAATEGKDSGLQTVATFTDPGGPEAASDYSAAITWGDSSLAAPGTITFDGTTGLFTVLGQHTYIEEGAFPISVTLHHDTAPDATTVSTANITDAALSATGVAVSGTEGASTGPVTVATFTDVNPNGAASDFTAAITWGDGQKGAGVIAANQSGGFIVTGTHTYAGGGSYAISVAIADLGGNTATATSTAKIANAALTVSLDAPAQGVPGEPLTFTGHFTDPLPQGHAVAWDFGDGTTIAFHPATDQDALMPTHIYTSTGKYTVTVTIQAADGAIGSASQPLAITAVTLAPDPCDPGKTALFVGGTTRNDTIRVLPASTEGDQEDAGKGGSACGGSDSDHTAVPGRREHDDHGQKGEHTSQGIQVLINGVVQGTFVPTGRLIIYGQAGDDDIQVAESLRLPAILYGDAGNDRLQGGGGPTVLLGGAGDDVLLGGSGRTILIGGLGADRLVGGPSDDILIGGTTSYDADHEALCALLTEWERTDLTYSQRVHNLTTGVGQNGAVKLTAATVFGDGAKDTLTGGPGQDWFFSDGQDTVTDRSASEIGTHTDSLREEKHPPLPCAEPTPVIDWSGSSKDSLEALARGDSNGKVSTPPPWTRAFVLDLAAAADTGDPNADIRITIPVAVAPQPGIGHREYVGVVG